MKNTKFTPGPWKILKDEKELVNIIKKTSAIINEYRIVNENEGLVTHSITNSANAALIAAAPEMFEALETSLKLLNEANALHGFRNAVFTRELEKLIEKARGE